MFTWSSFVIRWLAVSVLVFATYNPSGYSYVHWLTEWEPGYLALKVAIGLTIAALFWLMIVATWLVLRVMGIVLLLAIVLSLAGTLWQLGMVPATAASAQFLLLAGLATYLTIGVSYAHIRYRLTGQVQSRLLEVLPPPA